MASGWWKSTYDNLEAGSPVDFEVSTALEAPRGYPKLASIATGAGLFLAGTPCITVNNVIYYAGDDYVQDTDRPSIMRWDGQVNTEVLQVPYITGTTPAKAILSMTENDGCLYFSTWDSGTTSSNFAGRVFEYNIENGTIETFGDDVFLGGALPYSLTVSGGKLWVGSIKQDPTKSSSLWSIDLDDETMLQDHVMATGAVSTPNQTVTRATQTYTYRITGTNASGEGGGVPVAGVSVTAIPALNATTYNNPQWTVVASTAVTTPSVTPTATAEDGTGPFYYIRYVYITYSNNAYHSSMSARAAVQVGLRMTVSGAYSTDANVTHVGIVCESISNGTFFLPSDAAGGGFVFANNTAGGTWLTSTIDVSGSSAPSITNTNTSNPYDPTSYNVYRTAGGTTQGKIGNAVIGSFVDDGDAGDGTSPPSANAYLSPSSASVSVAQTDPLVTTTYVVTALNATGETNGNAVSVQAQATLTASNYITISWTAISGATGYNVYRTAGHSSTGKIFANTASTSVNDTGIVATAGSAPSENQSGTILGAVGCVAEFNNDLYVGLYQTSGSFATIQKRTSAGTWSTTTTAAPGGSAASYNGYTAMVEFGLNLYAAYWNDDATDVCNIQKFNGSTWSTVKTISGAGARPFLQFHVHNGICYVYGGGDAKTGILYKSSDGTTWDDISSMLPTSKESIPFMGTVNVIGGF